MKLIEVRPHDFQVKIFNLGIHNLISRITSWTRKQESTWEYNRLGIVATGILVQVTFAGAMMGILGLAGASPWAYTFGALFSFMANSIAFAQCPMRLVLFAFVLSIFVSSALSIYYGLQLLLL